MSKLVLDLEVRSLGRILKTGLRVHDEKSYRGVRSAVRSKAFGLRSLSAFVLAGIWYFRGSLAEGGNGHRLVITVSNVAVKAPLALSVQEWDNRGFIRELAGSSHDTWREVTGTVQGLIDTVV